MVKVRSIAAILLALVASSGREPASTVTDRGINHPKDLRQPILAKALEAWQFVLVLDSGRWKDKNSQHSRFIVMSDC
jgi:hypothetical protein